MATFAEIAAASGFTAEDIQYQLAHWDDNRGSLVITVTTILTTCASVAVVLRLLTRKAIIKISWKVDDYAILVAMIFALGLYAETILSVQYGTGKHILRVGMDGMAKTLNMNFAIQMTYTLCHLAIKCSLLFLYRAVLTLSNPRFKIAWYAIGAYVVAFTIASILGTLLQCLPINYGRERISGVAQGRCVNFKAQVIAMAALNSLADVALLVLPIPTLWNLQLPLRQKLGLCMIFSLGVFACAVGIARIYFIARVQDQKDFTFIQAEILIWSLVEPCVGIVCACLTTLRPMFRALGGGSQCLKSSGSKVEITSRSLLHTLRQKVSPTDRKSSTSFWSGIEQHAPTGVDEWSVASNGSGSMEMSSMGLNTLHYAERGMI